MTGIRREIRQTFSCCVKVRGMINTNTKEQINLEYSLSIQRKCKEERRNSQVSAIDLTEHFERSPVPAEASMRSSTHLLAALTAADRSFHLRAPFEKKEEEKQDNSQHWKIYSLKVMSEKLQCPTWKFTVKLEIRWLLVSRAIRVCKGTQISPTKSNHLSGNDGQISTHYSYGTALNARSFLPVRKVLAENEIDWLACLIFKTALRTSRMTHIKNHS